MKSKSPYVSVLLCVYNGGSELKYAIESILEQTFTDFELIIIDDGSTDDSWEVISKYASVDSRIVAKKQRNIGLTKSLNMGLALCKGAYIARQDADDISDPHRLEQQVALSKSHNLIFSRAYKNRKVVPSQFLLFFPFDVLFTTGNVLIHGTMFIEAKLLKQYRYDQTYRYAQDFDLYLRLFKGGYTPFVIKEPLYTVGVSQGQISNKNAAAQFECLINSMSKNSLNANYAKLLNSLKNTSIRNAFRVVIMVYLLMIFQYIRSKRD